MTKDEILNAGFEGSARHHPLQPSFSLIFSHLCSLTPTDFAACSILCGVCFPGVWIRTTIGWMTIPHEDPY